MDESQKWTVACLRNKAIDLEATEVHRECASDLQEALDLIEQQAARIAELESLKAESDDYVDHYRTELEKSQARTAALEAQIAAAEKQEPVAVTQDSLALESALAELVNKIDSDLDSGDLLQDARRASTAIDAILTGGDLVANAHDYYRERKGWYQNSVDFRIGWNACLDAIGQARLAAPLPSDGKDAIEALRAAEDALACCYNVTEWPADGESAQDAALKAVRAALAKQQQEG